MRIPASVVFLSYALATSCAASTPNIEAKAIPPRVESPFRVAVEGLCPKLRVHTLGSKAVLVYGTYGRLEDGTADAKQAVAVVDGDRLVAAPSLVRGLPVSPTGWASGDLDLGGDFPDGAWLERTVRTPAKVSGGALFDETRDAYTWQSGGWTRSEGRDARTRGPHVVSLSDAAMCGPKVTFALLATERLPTGETWIAGRCEDELHRAHKGALRIAAFDPRTRRWSKVDAPGSDLFDAIVNVGILAVSPREAYVYAFRPYGGRGAARPYLLRHDGRSVERIHVPFDASIVSLTRSADGATWAVVGHRDVQRTDDLVRWTKVPLPPPHFVDPVPESMHVLDVRAAGRDVWVHAAVPIAIGDETGRTHVLLTTRPWKEPSFCDRQEPAAVAVSASGRVLALAKVELVPLLEPW